MSGFLSPYRVLDLSDERGLLAGRMLAQLGADVVQVEPPGGSRARCVGPFAEDARPPHDSLYWSAYASGKRGLVVNQATAAGRDVLERLIASADILIESAAPDAREASVYKIASVRDINPAIIHVSITAFGSSGPKANYAATDLTVWAAGGPLLPLRDGTRPPLRISVPQSFLHAAADAAGGALIALHARRRSGRGQHVDVSAQQSTALCTLSTSLAAPFRHHDFSYLTAAGVPRNNQGVAGQTGAHRSKWRLRDGLLELFLGVGPIGGRYTNNLFRWLGDEGACDQEFASWDWVSLPQRLANGELSPSDLDRAAGCVERHLAGVSKHDMMEVITRYNLLCAPIATASDLLESPQLAARGYLESVVEGETRERTLPGRFAAGAPAAFVPLAPAPAPGQHSDTVLRDWLDATPAQIDALRAAGAIA